MEKKATKIQDAWLLMPNVYRDPRGFFLESWNRDSYRKLGLDADFVQDNHSRSTRHVLRGLHYQTGNAAQGKLVWVTSGSVFDVIVDLRKSSPTFGLWDSYVITGETHERLWIPAGCAHGFLVLSDFADFHYKVSKPYAPECERILQWNDPYLNIEWPLENGTEPNISLKDDSGLTFEECKIGEYGE